MACNTGKLAERISALRDRHEAADAEVRRLEGLGVRRTQDDDARLRLYKLRKLRLKEEIVAAEKRLLAVPVAEVVHDPKVLEVVVSSGVGSTIQVAA